MDQILVLARLNILLNMRGCFFIVHIHKERQKICEKRGSIVKDVKMFTYNLIVSSLLIKLPANIKKCQITENNATTLWLNFDKVLMCRIKVCRKYKGKEEKI